MKIPITKPVFDECEKEALLKPLETGWLVQGPNVAEFENMFCQYTKAGYARATTSCTTALHLGLLALGIGKGDKVVVPSFTYVASANSVEYTGAEVVFCDIDLNTFNIDVEACRSILENDRGKKIKAVMPVNLFGLCADLPAVCALAEEYKMRVIEDSACALGAFIGDKHSGTFGDAGCFSFHPRKAITTGEGGMLVTGDPGLDRTVSQLRDHGAAKSDLDRHKEKGGSLLPDFDILGFNFRMTDLQGALGVCQMKKLKRILEGRRRIAAQYDLALKDLSVLKTPYVPENYSHGYQSYVCLFSGGEDITALTREKIDALNVRRNKFMAALEEKGISVRQGTHAVHTLGYYRKKYNIDEEDFLNAYAADRLSITLPVYAGMTDEEFDYVIGSIKGLL